MLRVTSAISLSKHRESRWWWSTGCKSNQSELCNIMIVE